MSRNIEIVTPEIAKTDYQWGFNDIPRSPVAGIKELSWLGSDTLEKFEKNNPPGWSKTSIKYEFNRHGYRSIEFEKSDKFTIACFGCSHTIGIGVPLEYTWPYLFREKFIDTRKIDADCFNLGWGGASVDFICRIMYSFLENIKPDLVIVHFPSNHRYERYYIDATVNNILPVHIEAADFFENIDNDIYSKNIFLKNFIFIESMLELYNIPWIFSSWNNEVKNIKCDNKHCAGYIKKDYTERARDMQHLSLKTYTNVADRYMKKYNELY